MAKKRRRGASEGTIYQRKDGRWAAQVTVGYDAEGRQKRATVYGKTRAEVVEKLDQLRLARRTGTLVENHKITLSEWLERWLSVYQRPAVSKKTYALQRMLVRRHIIPDLGHIPLLKLKPNTIQHLYASKLESLSSQTVRHIHNILNKALKQAEREGLIPRNPVQATSPPKVVRQNEMRPLTREEVGRLLSALEGERLGAAFILGLATGLRRGELLALRWSDIDLDKATLQVRRALDRVVQDDGTTRLEFTDVKTPKSRRLIPLAGEVIRVLKAHKARQAQEKLALGEAYKEADLVFATTLGTPVCPRSFLRLWARILKRAGIPHTRFHNLRHTFATLLLEGGEHPKVVQELLGHSTVSMTLDTYSHLVPGLKERAAATVDGIIKEARASSAAR